MQVRDVGRRGGHHVERQRVVQLGGPVPPVLRVALHVRVDDEHMLLAPGLVHEGAGQEHGACGLHAAALAAGLALILALIVWFWYDHSKPDFAPCFWGSIGVIVASILIRAFAEWILERPTRAERRAMKRAAAQETGRVTMRMPVSEEVAAAFESTRDGRRASL